MIEITNQPEQSLTVGQQRGKRIFLALLSYKVILLIIMVLGLILGITLLPFKAWLVSILEWTQGLGFWAPVFVVALYIVACVLLIPGSILTIGAGFLFKVVGGTITVSIGSMLGACTAFLVGRTIARNWIAGKVAKNEKFAAIDEAVGQQGFKIVLLTRLSPVFPFNLLNYAFGLTKVSFWKYVLASWIGMIPGTIMYVYFGAGLRSFADLAAGKVDGGMAGKFLFWFGMGATVVLTIFITRIARRSLKNTVPQTHL